MAVLNDVVDLLDQADSDDGDKGNRYCESQHALGKGELLLLGILVLVLILSDVLFKDGIIDTLMGTNLEEDVDGVGNNEENSCDTRDLKDFRIDLFKCRVSSVCDGKVKSGRDDQTKATTSCQQI